MNKTLLLTLLVLCISGCANTTSHFPRCNDKAPLHYTVYISWEGTGDDEHYIHEEAGFLGWVNVDYYSHFPGAKYAGEITGSCPLSHELPQ